METLTGIVTHRIPFTRLHSTSDDGQRFICLHYEPDNKVGNETNEGFGRGLTICFFVLNM